MYLNGQGLDTGKSLTIMFLHGLLGLLIYVGTFGIVNPGMSGKTVQVF